MVIKSKRFSPWIQGFVIVGMLVVADILLIELFTKMTNYTPPLSIMVPIKNYNHLYSKNSKKTETVVLGKPIISPIREAQPKVSGGKAPVISKINTTQPVVFLTIDDGGTKNANMLSLLQNNGIKASLFLDNNFIANNYDFFKPFQAAGMTIQNHAVHHIYAKPGAISYEDQRKEICGMADIIQNVYGRRPTLYRAPGGWIDDNTATAAASCGAKAVVQWSAKVNGGAVQYQVGSKFRPGDIVLMHFRPEFESDLNAFIAAKNAAGLTTDYLENWL